MLIHAPSVLILDDQDSQRRLYTLLAERFGLDAHIVTGGKEALACLDRVDFDLVIMDWEMPDMNGGEWLPLFRYKLQGRGAYVPIVCITACAMVGDREMCLEAGMDDYLAKPFTMSQFKDLLYRWLPAHINPAEIPRIRIKP